MDKKDISLGDWQRILFGKAPAEFLLEVLVRAGVIYFLLLIVVKLMGKRMSGRLTITEWAVMMTLGSLISLPMQAPERGILNGIVLLLLVFIFHRVQAWWTFRHRRAEEAVLGTMAVLVKDGVMDTGELDRLRMSREQLFSVLRGKKIYQLGAIQRLYQEATGDYSLYKAGEPRPGLSALPPDEGALHTQETVPGLQACRHCGHVQRADALAACGHCGRKEWERAVK